jgi:glycosyltransferase involved in cell wall biosynthesis
MVDQYVRIRYGAKLAIAGIAAEHFMRALLDWYYAQAQLILAPSDAVRDMLRPRFTAPVVTLTRGVDHEIFAPHHRRRAHDGNVRALYVGRVAEEKGLDKLVEFFGRGPHTSLTDTSLTIVGDGPWLDCMRRALPSARYTGKLIGPALSREFANADFFVFPSETDSFGNVVLQAMSAGLPVVVTDALGAKQSVIPNVTGFVARNRSEFAAACARLASDPMLRRRMASAARAHALTFRWKDIVDELLRLYGTAGRTAHATSIAA